jgi:hypothetical protein
MPTSPSRRDILRSSIALAAGVAAASHGNVSSAMADTSSPTAPEIVAAIRSKKMTAVTAVRDALERAEQLKDLNAFIILNKEGALAAAGQVDSGAKTGALAGRRRRAKWFQSFRARVSASPESRASSPDPGSPASRAPRNDGVGDCYT